MPLTVPNFGIGWLLFAVTITVPVVEPLALQVAPPSVLRLSM